jgi:hypothetical protein
MLVKEEDSFSPKNGMFFFFFSSSPPKDFTCSKTDFGRSRASDSILPITSILV